MVSVVYEMNVFSCDPCFNNVKVHQILIRVVSWLQTTPEISLPYLYILTRVLFSPLSAVCYFCCTSFLHIPFTLFIGVFCPLSHLLKEAPLPPF